MGNLNTGDPYSPRSGALCVRKCRNPVAEVRLADTVAVADTIRSLEVLRAPEIIDGSQSVQIPLVHLKGSKISSARATRRL